MLMPLFKFPLPVILVDDNQPFLETAPAQLPADYVYRCFDKPKALLTDLNQQQQHLFKLEDYLHYDLSIESKQQHHLHIDISELHQLISDPKRLQQPGVLVIDYAMPSLDGLSFCEQLQDKHVKKVLITGQADHSIAVEAFNAGIIDKFILKQETDFFPKLSEMITELQERYFVDLTQVLFKDLELSPYFCLADENVQRCLKDIFATQSIREYYLLDASGSLLLIDNDNQQHILMLRSEAELQMLSQIAADNDAPADLLTNLQTRDQIPLLLTEADHALPVSDWPQRCFPATRITGANTSSNYYYSLAALSDIPDLVNTAK